MEKRKISEEKVWLKHFGRDLENIKLPECKAVDYIYERNKGNLDLTALHYYGKDITYGRLFEMIDEAAAGFTALGVKKGDIVSFLSVGTPETIAAFYALNVIGATANTIDPRLDIANISRMIQESGSKVLLFIDIAYPKVKLIQDEIKAEKLIVVSAALSLPLFKKIALTVANRTDIPYGNTIIKWSTFIRNGNGAKVIKSEYVGDDVVTIAYTGGTTGFPKGVMLTNDSMNSVVLNFEHSGLEYKSGDRFLGIIPIFTSYGAVCGLHMPLGLSLTVVPIPKFIPAEFGKIVMQFRPNHMVSTPAFYEMLMNSNEVQGKDLSFLTTLGSGGDTMNEGLEAKFQQFLKDHKAKHPVSQGYGMSELSAAASFNVNDFFKDGSVGIPSVFVTASIFDPETGEELGYGEVGEICVTGPSVMKGYFNRPEETDYVKRLHPDGQYWIHSGDVGYMDEDGFLFIKGRIKRMITRFDGHKVFPVNLESVVGERPDVRNCSVIGVNDRDHSNGQYPLIVIKTVDGVDERRVCSEIFSYCDENVEERGKPVAVLSVKEFPLTGAGKNDYRALEKKYADYDYRQWEL